MINLPVNDRETGEQHDQISAHSRLQCVGGRGLAQLSRLSTARPLAAPAASAGIEVAVRLVDCSPRRLTFGEQKVPARRRQLLPLGGGTH